MTTLQALQLLESAAAEGNHAAERDAALGAVREGTARLVATHSLVTTAGQRAKLQDVAEQMVPAAEKPGSKPGGEPPPLVEAREYGTILEVEPNVDADGLHISLNIALEHRTARPELTSIAGHPDLPKFHIKSCPDQPQPDRRGLPVVRHLEADRQARIRGRGCDPGRVRERRDPAHALAKGYPKKGRRRVAARLVAPFFAYALAISALGEDLLDHVAVHVGEAALDAVVVEA